MKNTPENRLRQQIILATSQQVRWFRNNVGKCQLPSGEWCVYGIACDVNGKHEGGPDYVGIRKSDGRFVALEIKAPGCLHLATSAQLENLRRMREAGAITILADSLSTVEEALGE